ncbi:MAG TPA: DUF167 domain-containing protein [Streptosporangiaceae bacterium]
MRITIWVRPGSASARVGGEHGGALVIRVTERPVDGKATEAAMAALATALGIQRRAVRLVAGASSRKKIVDVTGVDPSAVSRLLAGPAG